MIPAGLRGRVFALTALLGATTFSAAVALGGWLGDRWDVRWPLLGASLAHVAVGGALLATRRVREQRIAP